MLRLFKCPHPEKHPRFMHRYQREFLPDAFFAFPLSKLCISQITEVAEVRRKCPWLVLILGFFRACYTHESFSKQCTEIQLPEVVSKKWSFANNSWICINECQLWASSFIITWQMWTKKQNNTNLHKSIAWSSSTRIYCIKSMKKFYDTTLTYIRWPEWNYIWFNTHPVILQKLQPEARANVTRAHGKHSWP